MSSHGGNKAIIAELSANLGIAVTKFIAWAFSGSSSMLAEGVHSLADSGNQLLLLLGGRKAKKAADADHPFGHGREHRLHILGQHVVAALQRGPGARRLQQGDRRARAQAFGEHAVLARGGGQALHIIGQRGRHVQRAQRLLGGGQLGRGHRRRQRLEQRAAVFAEQQRAFGGRQHAQRLPDRGAAHAELPGERGLDRQPLAGGQLPGDDQLPKLVGDLLVRPAYAADGHPGHGRDCP